MKKYIALLLFIAGFVYNANCVVFTPWDWNPSIYFPDGEGPGGYSFKDVLPHLAPGKAYCVSKANYMVKKGDSLENTDLKFEEYSLDPDGVYSSGHDLGWFGLYQCSLDGSANDNMASTFLFFKGSAVDGFFVHDSAGKRTTPKIPDRLFCKNNVSRSCWDGVVGRWRTPLESAVVIRVYVIINYEKKIFRVHTFPFHYNSDFFVILGNIFADKDIALEVPWLTRCVSLPKYAVQAKEYFKKDTITGEDQLRYCYWVMNNQESAAAKKIQHKNSTAPQTSDLFAILNKGFRNKRLVF